MRHQKKGRKLGRNAPHRTSLKRNLLMGLFTHERITTTIPKAKELRPFVEKIITVAVAIAKKEQGSRQRRRRDTMLSDIFASRVVKNYEPGKMQSAKLGKWQDRV